MKAFRTTRHLFFVLLVLSGLASCQKQDFQRIKQQKETVVFSSKAVRKGTTKSVIPTPDYAIIGIQGKIFKTAVYTVGGTVYTTAIKLVPGNYTLTRFILMNSGNSASDSTDDIPVYALPLAGSDYSAFVSRAAGFSFSVGSLGKEEVPVEVLLFKPKDYQKFGFDFDILPNTTVRNQLFAGKFYPARPQDYTGSLYQSQTNGLQSGMPAIFRIDVFRNGNFVKSFTNQGLDETRPLKVDYPDGNGQTDHFRFDLFLYAKTGNGFGYRFIHSWFFSDDQMLHHGSDGVTHFVVGNTREAADYHFGPYLNLPEKCSLTVEPGYAPGTLGSYFDGNVLNVPPGYRISDGTRRFWCGTDTVNINLGHPYTMNVYSSLTPDALPAYTRNPQRWNAINWLFNHLENYPFYDWDILQGAFWMLLNDWNGTGHSGVSDANSVVIRMANDARHHTGYTPGFGEKAAVIFIPDRTPHEEQTPKVQVVFTFVRL
jgi:hypothetical protein